MTGNELRSVIGSVLAILFFFGLFGLFICLSSGDDWRGPLVFMAPWPMYGIILAGVRLHREMAPARERAREQASARRRQHTEREVERLRKRAEREALRGARSAEAQARREALAARQEAEAYYRANAALLAGVLPPALFRAEVATVFPPEAAPEAAWRASRELIARMQPLVRQAEERNREEEKRRQRLARQLADIDDQIRAHQARIARVRASGLDPDAIEDEVAALNQAVERLQERRRGLELEGE